MVKAVSDNKITAAVQWSWYWTWLAQKSGEQERAMEMNICKRLLKWWQSVLSSKSIGSLRKISSKLFSLFSNFFLGYESGINMILSFYSHSIRNTASCLFFACVYEKERWLEIESSVFEKQQENAQFRHNNGFYTLCLETPNESAASESDSSGTWKMSCMYLFRALIPD